MAYVNKQGPKPESVEKDQNTKYYRLAEDQEFDEDDMNDENCRDEEKELVYTKEEMV